MGLVQFAVKDGTGKITGIGVCSHKNLQHKIARGLKVVVGKADDRLHKIVDDKIVLRSDPEPIHAVSENLEPIVRILLKDWNKLIERIEALEKK